ncbi:MAG: PilT/PilU family type 4a pilus ATPase [Deltaproteobacteria bacterium]|nr:PilT/PilU family type 4a pilus ATPase [Deltaproteobacteria bacterium]
MTTPPPSFDKAAKPTDPLVEPAQVFDAVLRKAVELGASDVHITAGNPFRVRINVQIRALQGTPPLTPSDTEAIAKRILLGSKRATPADVDQQVRELRDLDCSYGLAGAGRFRVNICSQRGSIALVLRNIPMRIPNFDELGLPAVLNQVATAERGLILVTGVTGSGKSTTMAAMLDLINRTRNLKIVTIEDPIEYLHKDARSTVLQREVGSDTESFAKAMRAALRQDPDVVMVGEMRDRETIDIALKAAETGHVVLSTLHTSDVVKTIQRVIGVYDLSEMAAARLRLAENLQAVIAQRLIPRADGGGRLPAVEVMRTTLAIRESIISPEKTDLIRDLVHRGTDQYGMQTFDQHLRQLYLSQLITYETARTAATSPADFERNLHFTT